MAKRKTNKTCRVFDTFHEGNTLKVFMGDPAILGLEAEFVLQIDKTLVPALIAALRDATPKRVGVCK